MTKDPLGNDIKTGDIVLFNGIVCNVKEIQSSSILQGKSISKSNVQ